MSKWFDGILELKDIKNYQFSFSVLEITFDDYDKIKYYSNCFSEIVVFKYVYLDCSSNKMSRKNIRIFKNCFITSMKINNEDFIINFHYSEETKDEEYNIVLRGIKINKLKMKIAS